MAKEKKRKPVNSVRVTRAKKGEDEPLLYERIDEAIDSSFPDLRGIDYVIVLKKSWRADGSGNLKQVQVKLRPEEDRILLGRGKNQGADALFLLNAETFGDPADIEDAELDFWVYQLLASVEPVKFSDGSKKYDENDRVVYRTIKPDLALHSAGIVKHGIGGVRAVAAVVDAARRMSEASVEQQKMLFFPDEFDVDVVPYESDESDEEESSAVGDAVTA